MQLFEIVELFQILKDDAVINMPANLENSAVATGLEKISFHSIPKKGNAKECSNYYTIALISHASKVMLKIFQAKLQEYMNRELTDVHVGFRKRQRKQRSNCEHLLDHRKSNKKKSQLQGQKPLGGHGIMPTTPLDNQPVTSYEEAPHAHCMTGCVSGVRSLPPLMPMPPLLL